MPKETFYDPSATEGAVPTPDQHLDVTWARGTGVWLGPVQIDPSGIDRLIKTLRKAREQGYPDWKYNAPPNQWQHPETGIVINDEDMPNELRP